MKSKLYYYWIYAEINSFFFLTLDVQQNLQSITAEIAAGKISSNKNSVCVTNVAADIPMDGPFGIYFGGLKLFRGGDIELTLTNNQFVGSAGNFELNAYVIINKPLSYVTSCQYDKSKSMASRKIPVQVDGTKLTFLLSTIVQEAISYVGQTLFSELVIYFEPVSGEENAGKISTGSTITADAKRASRKQSIFSLFKCCCSFF
jgi:hypothetical protein